MVLAVGSRPPAGYVKPWALALAVIALEGGCGPAARVAPSRGRRDPEAIRWRLVHHETFDAPFANPPWVEDAYGEASPYHVDAFDEDGAFFVARGGATFTANLARFRSFRRASQYGEDGWLTVELYGRDSDRDGVPEDRWPVRERKRRGAADLHSPLRWRDHPVDRAAAGALPHRGHGPFWVVAGRGVGSPSRSILPWWRHHVPRLAAVPRATGDLALQPDRR